MNIYDIDFIPMVLRQRLAEADIHSLNDLSSLHTSPKRCLEVSEETDISLPGLREIIATAIFHQIPGIGAQHSSLLVKIGIDSVEKLSIANVEAMIISMGHVKSKVHKNFILPDRSVLDRWKQSAQRALKAERSSFV